MMADAVTAARPVSVVFVFLQRYSVPGIALTGLKGKNLLGPPGSRLLVRLSVDSLGMGSRPG